MQRPEWRITKLRGEFALTFDRDGKRHRYTLNTDDAREAERTAPALYAELNRPKGRTVKDLWSAYCTEKAAKPIATTMKFTGKAIGPHFGHRDGEAVTQAECESYTAYRRKQGRSDGAIHTELGHLRTVLVWAQKKRLIGHAPEITRPQKPSPKNRHLTKDEARTLIEAASLPHIKLAIHLMLATAARVSAILELTWKRVDLPRRRIHLIDPEAAQGMKGRATPPINNTLYAALQEAQKGSLSGYVVEWGGEGVKSIKKGIASAAKKAGLADVSPHVFRHTAAVWMAEAGVPMSEISQYLGHSNQAVTYRVYARYSPEHLRKAADALELYEVLSVTDEPENENEPET